MIKLEFITGFLSMTKITKQPIQMIGKTNMIHQQISRGEQPSFEDNLTSTPRSNVSTVMIF